MSIMMFWAEARPRKMDLWTENLTNEYMFLED